MTMVTQSRLKHLCDYDPATGLLFWKRREENEIWVASWNLMHAGKPVGHLSKHGYLSTSVDNHKYQVHRLVWLFIRGQHPSDFIDHINGDRKDNRIQNLRIAPMLVNGKNQALRSNNKSGVMGVSWSSRRKQWSAQIMVAGKTIHLGFHSTLDGARAAREAANRKYNFHPNHGRAAA